MRKLMLAVVVAWGSMALGSIAPAAADPTVLDVYDWDGDEAPGTIVIETSERRLYFVLGEGEAYSWPIAVGKEGAQWHGSTSIIKKAENPSWRPTESIRRENPKLPPIVPPGPKNPLGVRGIYLAQGALRIHGTNAPKSIGTAASHGCFRMRNADVVDLFDLVDVGAKVIVNP